MLHGGTSLCSMKNIWEDMTEFTKINVKNVLNQLFLYVEPILPNQCLVLHTPKALPTFTYRIGEIIHFSPPIRVFPLLSREGEI